MTDPVRIQWRGPTAVVVFDRPPVNAVDLPTVQAWVDLLRTLEADPPTGGVVITGTERAFCGGVDIKALPTYSRAQLREMVLTINRFIRALYGLGTATVAAVSGHAIGAGSVIFLACDMRIAAAGAYRIGLTEVTAGIPYPACPMAVVTAELDPGLRRRLVLTGRVFDPAEAHELGVVDRVVPAETLEDEAVTLARELASARAYSAVKAQLKASALAAMDRIIASEDDPMLTTWLV